MVTKLRQRIKLHLLIAVSSTLMTTLGLWLFLTGLPHGLQSTISIADSIWMVPAVAVSVSVSVVLFDYGWKYQTKCIEHNIARTFLCCSDWTKDTQLALEGFTELLRTQSEKHAEYTKQRSE